jgi:hypothetical protein
MTPSLRQRPRLDLMMFSAIPLCFTRNIYFSKIFLIYGKYFMHFQYQQSKDFIIINFLSSMCEMVLLILVGFLEAVSVMMVNMYFMHFQYQVVKDFIIIIFLFAKCKMFLFYFW